MKNKIEQEESLFKNLNLNEAREEGESYEDYKIRRKSNRRRTYRRRKIISCAFSKKLY